MNNDIRKIIKQLIREETLLSEARFVRTREGQKVSFESDDHVTSLEEDLAELVKIRDTYPPQSRRRASLTAAVGRVRKTLKRAQRRNEKQKQLIQDQENK